MQISQIFFTDGNSQLSKYLTGCVEKAKSIAPAMKHVLYDIDMAREFIQAKFGSETIEAFDKLNPYAYKADLLRYCLLFAEGGWYFDVGVTPAISNVNVPANIETLVFKDAPIISGTTWTCASAVLYSRPKQKVYEQKCWIF
jgi:mannosyltransferase OCH1-like enzyme